MASASDELTTALESPDPTARQLALIALEDQVEPELLAPLLRAARDADATVRRLAIGMLEEIGDPKAVPAVVAGLADEDGGVREAAQSAIREFRGPEAAEQLFAAADHPSPAVRTWVIVGLRELKDGRAMPILLRALGDASADVRRAAVVTLAYLRSDAGFAALVPRLEDEDAGVRRLAVAALGRSWSNERAPAVIARLTDDDWQVRAEAAAALGQGGAVEAAGPLIQATRDSHWQVVKAAASALGALKALREKSEATPALLHLLESDVPDVRRAGAQALGELRTASAGPRLRGLLTDADIEVRKAATRALEILSTSVLALVVLFALTVAGCKPSASSAPAPAGSAATTSEATTIRVAIGTQDKTINCATGGLVIREEHLLEKYLPHDGKYAGVHWDVEWKDFPTGMTLTSEMIAGKLDFGSMGDFPSVLNAVAFQKQGQKTLYVSTLSGSATGAGNGLLVPTDSRAQTLADLKGKTISVPFGSAAHGMLLRAVRDLGWDPERDVNIVAQTPEVGGSSLMADKVDGHADFVPFAELFPFRGFARKILDGSTVGVPTSHGTLVNAAYAKDYPEVVVAFIKAEIEAGRLFTGDPEKYSRLVEKVSGVEAEVAYMFHGPLGIQTRDFTIKPELKKGLGIAVETLKLLKKTDADLDVDAFVDDHFVREAAREMGVDYDARLKSYEPDPLTTPDAKTGQPITDPKSAAQLWVDGEEKVRAYASPAAAFAAYAQAERDGHKVRGAFVHDHGTGLKLLAKTAWFVDAHGALSAFLSRKDADAYAAAQGGRVVTFDQAKSKT
jgi:NitT/TauT family transport system substrate-binding protein